MANPGHNTVNIQTHTYEAFYAAVRAKHGSKKGALSLEATNALKAYLPRLTPKEKPTPQPSSHTTANPPIAKTANPSMATRIQPTKAKTTQQTPPTEETHPYQAPCGERLLTTGGLNQHIDTCLACSEAITET